jgi:hypothetical protein
MVNLIPQHAKQTVSIEYYIRVITVWLWLLTAALVVVGVLLFPVGLLVKLQLAALDSAYIEAQSGSDAYKASEKIVMEANALAEELVRVNSKQPVWDDVSRIYNLIPPGITISSISLKKINLTGEAKTRNDLATTRDIFRADERFTGVALPLSNLAKGVDLPFNVTLDVKQP